MTSEVKSFPMQIYTGERIIAYYRVKKPNTPERPKEIPMQTYIGTNPNHPDFPGHISWSPKEVFERAYDGKFMSFGHALELLKDGRQVYRKGWNGKGMWLILVRPEDDDTPHDGPGYSLWRMQGIVGEALPWIGMRTADDKFVPWLASQTDMLADDWMVAE